MNLSGYVRRQYFLSHFMPLTVMTDWRNESQRLRSQALHESSTERAQANPVSSHQGNIGFLATFPRISIGQSTAQRARTPHTTLCEEDPMMWAAKHQHAKGVLLFHPQHAKAWCPHDWLHIICITSGYTYRFPLNPYRLKNEPT